MNEQATPNATAAPAEKPKKPVPKSLQMCRQQLANLYHDSMEAKKRGELIGWSTSIFPQEIAEVFDLYILYPENHAAGISARHKAQPFLEHAEGALEYPNDICAYAKTNLAYLDMINEDSDMAKPDFVLVANNICSQISKWFENVAREAHIPLFLIDCVYNYEDEVTPSRVKYIRDQLDELIKNLEKLTGKAFDYKKFERVMEISIRNTQLWKQANELMANKPAPLSGFELFNYMSCMVCARGKEETTEILLQLIAEMKENIAAGKSTFPAEEEYRIYWNGIACWPYLGHNLKTMKKYGMNIVCTAYVTAWALDYEKNDLDGMARAYSYVPGNNVNLDVQLRRRVEALKLYDFDGFVYHMNRSCKVMDCQQYELQRKLTEAIGIPFATFDGDQADYRNYSEAQFETRIQALVEIMKQNKEAKKQREAQNNG